MLKTMTDKELKEVRDTMVQSTISFPTTFSGSIFFRQEKKSWERGCFVAALKGEHVLVLQGTILAGNRSDYGFISVKTGSSRHSI